MSQRRPRTGISDVAAAAGVSRTTVSMVLNDKGRVSAETRERVRQAARELNYRPSLRAQRLRGGRSRTVALYNPVQSLLPRETQFDFALELAMPFAQACLARGYSLLLIPPLTSEEQVEQFDIDGIVVMDPVESDPYCATFSANGARVVTIGRADGTVADAVVERRYAGADVILEHLVERGARRIAIIVSEEAYATRAEVLRYLDEVGLPAGVSVSVERIPTVDGEAGGYRVGRALLTASTPPDAVYAPMSTFAIGVVRAADELGLRMPEDLKVAANFDGRQTANATTPVTTLDLRLPELASVASALLLDLLDDGVVRSATAPKPRIVARASTIGTRRGALGPDSGTIGSDREGTARVAGAERQR